MAIFYMRTSIVRASSGKSAVASAAYQSAQSLYDEKLNCTFSYSRKEEVIHSEIMLPDNAPKSFHDRQTLWNSVEAKESKSNSRYARQFVIATPREWGEAETIERAREFIQTALVDKGMCVDWAFHRKDDNPHIHIMATVRGFNPDGSWAVMERKTYALDENGERIPEIDPETGEQLTFISNITDQLEFNGVEIANIYRHRWDIESFFKLIKQNLTVKHLLGCSENAVKTHLWIAICSYLLLARIKAMYDSPYSITEIGTLVRVFALVKTDLKKLVTEPQPLIQNQDVNELTLF